MKYQDKNNFSGAPQRKMIVEMINAGFSLAEKLGRRPLTKGCNCMACIHKRKRIPAASERG